MRTVNDRTKTRPFARFPGVVPSVSQPDPGARRALPRDRAGLSRVRRLGDARSRDVSIHVRPTSEIIESLLERLGFARFGLYMQDYGGPVGFRIVTRRPEWLEWLIIQNTNAYEVGFTSVWDALRGAYWKNSTAETEKPLEAFLKLETIRQIYMHGHPKPELVSPDNWNMDLHLPRTSQCAARAARPLLRLSHERAALPGVAGVPEQ